MVQLTNNKTVLKWIEEMKALSNRTMWFGLTVRKPKLRGRAQANSTGEMHKLNEEKLFSAVICIVPLSMMLRVWNTALLSAQQPKMKRDRPTTGWLLTKLIKCFTI